MLLIHITGVVNKCLHVTKIDRKLHHNYFGHCFLLLEQQSTVIPTLDSKSKFFLHTNLSVHSLVRVRVSLTSMAKKIDNWLFCLAPKPIVKHKVEAAQESTSPSKLLNSILNFSLKKIKYTLYLFSPCSDLKYTIYFVWPNKTSSTFRTSSFKKNEKEIKGPFQHVCQSDILKIHSKMKISGCLILLITVTATKKKWHNHKPESANGIRKRRQWS